MVKQTKAECKKHQQKKQIQVFQNDAAVQKEAFSMVTCTEATPRKLTYRWTFPFYNENTNKKYRQMFHEYVWTTKGCPSTDG